MVVNYALTIVNIQVKRIFEYTCFVNGGSGFRKSLDIFHDK